MSSSLEEESEMGRHKIFFAVALALMTIGFLAACEQREAPADVAIPAAPAVGVDAVNHTITLTDPMYPSTPVIIRVDVSTRTQYMDCGDFHVVNGMNSFVEYTSRDYLEISFQELDNGSYVERYLFNGRVLELEIDNLTGPTDSQIEQFLDLFPTDPAMNTLANHPDGRFMADVFTRAEPGLAMIVQAGAGENGDYSGGRTKDEIPGIQLLRPDWKEWIKRGCALAGVCSGIACRFFPANPVCEFCAGASLACALVMLVNWGDFWY